jgi:cytoskeletal protein CcmA (bactofilin family)
MPSSTGEAVIGKDLTIVGQITGDSPLFADGRVEGSIQLPGARVTIGVNGHVKSAGIPSGDACISAGEVIILGHIVGNVLASDRVEIRAQGSLRGDLRTARLAIADGAYFQGSIEITKAD